MTKITYSYAMHSLAPESPSSQWDALYIKVPEDLRKESLPEVITIVVNGGAILSEVSLNAIIKEICRVGCKEARVIPYDGGLVVHLDLTDVDEERLRISNLKQNIVKSMVQPNQVVSPVYYLSVEKRGICCFDVFSRNLPRLMEIHWRLSLLQIPEMKEIERLSNFIATSPIDGFYLDMRGVVDEVHKDATLVKLVKGGKEAYAGNFQNYRRPKFPNAVGLPSKEKLVVLTNEGIDLLVEDLRS